MKKLTYIAILLLVAFGAVSCSKEYGTVQDRIAFDVALGAQSTKATKSTGTYSGADFGTYAWKTSGTWSATGDTSKLSNPYMVNAKTTKTDSKWYPGSFRWPASVSNLHFVCYAPYKATSPMTYDLTNGISFKDYTIDYSESQEDLLYSDLSKDNYNDSVNIAFRHALCQIVVKLKTDTIPSGLTGVVSGCSVTLKSLSVVGLKNKGTFKQNPSASPAWSDLSGNVTMSLFSGTKVLTTKKEDSCAAFYVLPQAFETGVQGIKLTYDVSITYKSGTNKTKTNTITDETHYFSSISQTSGSKLTSWAIGKQITYTLTVSSFGDVLSFGASTEDWGEVAVDGNLGGD